MGPIVLYTQAKNWEDPYSRFGEQAISHLTNGRNDGRTGRGQFIGPASKLSGSKNYIQLENFLSFTYFIMNDFEGYVLVFECKFLRIYDERKTNKMFKKQ